MVDQSCPYFQGVDAGKSGWSLHLIIGWAAIGYMLYSVSRVEATGNFPASFASTRMMFCMNLGLPYKDSCDPLIILNFPFPFHLSNHIIIDVILTLSVIKRTLGG